MSAPQSVRDALADAETLRLNFWCSAAMAEQHGHETARWMRAVLREVAPRIAAARARRAASAAFRAVPGLREARP